MTSGDKEALTQYISDLHLRGELYDKAGESREANQIFKIAAELQQMINQ
ncbi:hypothetical protein [Cytobacillus gottheilii]|nr:hypothetical protein [Cytobacillus gottheilii]